VRAGSDFLSLPVCSAVLSSILMKSTPIGFSAASR
jgi:hypothetical protein